MEILLIIFIIIAALAAVSLFLLLYKNGRLLDNKLILSLIALLITIITFMSFTALPSNYTFLKSIAFALGTIGILGCILYLTNKKNTLIGRIMIGFSIIGSCLLLIL